MSCPLSARLSDEALAGVRAVIVQVTPPLSPARVACTALFRAYEQLREHCDAAQRGWEDALADAGESQHKRTIDMVKSLAAACKQDIRDASRETRQHEEGRHAGLRQVLQMLRAKP